MKVVKRFSKQSKLLPTCENFGRINQKRPIKRVSGKPRLPPNFGCIDKWNKNQLNSFRSYKIQQFLSEMLLQKSCNSLLKKVMNKKVRVDLRLQADRYIFRPAGGFFMWTWRGKFLNMSSSLARTHPVPVRWAAAEEGSPAAGGRAVTPPGTPECSSYPAGICPAQGGKETSVLRIRDILVPVRMRIRIFGSVTLTNGSADADPGGPKTR